MTVPVTISDARARVAVTLPDGTVGVLIGLTYRTRMAKIRTGDGRYRRLPASMLTLHRKDHA